jgi:hypothetical protein
MSFQAAQVVTTGCRRADPRRDASISRSPQSFGDESLSRHRHLLISRARGTVRCTHVARSPVTANGGSLRSPILTGRPRAARRPSGDAGRRFSRTGRMGSLIRGARGEGSCSEDAGQVRPVPLPGMLQGFNPPTKPDGGGAGMDHDGSRASATCRLGNALPSWADKRRP